MEEDKSIEKKKAEVPEFVAELFQAMSEKLHRKKVKLCWFGVKWRVVVPR